MTSALAGNVQLPPQQSVNIGPAVSGATSGINSLQSTYGGLGGSVLPQAQATASNLYNNPFAQQGLAGAQGAAGLGGNAALSGYNTGNYLTNAGTSLVPYAQQIMQSGFDPQQALYNQQYQQNQAQTNVQNAMSGVATTPYGAGLANQSSQNFNTNWENQELARQAQAAQAAGGLVSAGAGVAGQGVTMANQAPSQLVQSAMIPYATYSDIGQGQNQALSQLLGIGQSGANLSNMSVQDFLGLLSGGNSANSVANQQGQLALNQANSAFNQYGTLADAGAGVLGNLFPSLKPALSAI